MSLEANASNVGQMDGYTLNPNLETEVVNPPFEQWGTAARKQSVKVTRVKEWKVRVDWYGYVWEHMEDVQNQSDDQLGFDDVIHDC